MEAGHDPTSPVNNRNLPIIGGPLETPQETAATMTASSHRLLKAEGTTKRSPWVR
jgi:hypothetical protein